MKKIIPFTTLIFFCLNSHSYEVKLSKPVYRSIPSPSDSTLIDPAHLPPPQELMVIEKPFISFRCRASLDVIKISKNKEGWITSVKNKRLSSTKDLGRLHPNEDWFQNANYGIVDFNFKIQNKLLAFDLIISGPDGEDSSTSSNLNITLSYHKTFKSDGKQRWLASKEANHIDLDGDKTLPGGFKLAVDLGKKAFKNHSSSLKVHCTDPKKEMRPVEVFID